jgi:hypothetical protein
MKNILLFILICLASCNKKTLILKESIKDQIGLPYKSLVEYRDEYSAETISARTIDGLGFRFYWATEGLREEDLKYRPSAGARTSEETIDHIMGLAIIIKNAIEGKQNRRSGEETSPLTFQEKRKITLDYLQASSLALQSGKLKVKDLKIQFVSGDNRVVSYPWWNMMNGPIADALWHVGQVVTFRRSSGNPFNSKVSVLTGTVRE